MDFKGILFFVAISICSLTTISYGESTSTPSYDTKYDNIDLDELLQSERLLTNYVKCLELEGPCTPDAKMLRDTLPDAISSDCLKCSEKQKYGADKVTHFLIDQKPEIWERLEKIYDPTGSYRMRYLEMKTTNNSQSNTGGVI